MSSPSILAHYMDIAQKLPGYEPRPMQEAMVAKVYEGIETGTTTVIEAGTGSGKSFGYLIPALFSKKRPIVISTGTIALQEQLLEKDIPFIAQAAGIKDLTVRLVKGRRNYLCLQKVREFEKTLSAHAPERLYVSMVKSAFDTGWDGDRANLDVEIPREIWEEMQSDAEDCLGHRCSFYKENPYRLAREDLDKADILVVNHALYMQDLISGQALLPPHDTVIFDEAHHLKSFALGAFTARIGKYATAKLLRKIDRRLQRIPEAYLQAITHSEAQILEWLFHAGKGTFKLSPDPVLLSAVDQQVAVLGELREWLASVDVKQLTLVETEAEENQLGVQRTKLLNQLDALSGKWAFFSESFDPNRVNWAEVKPDRLYYEIKSTPLNIADHLNTNLWQERTGILTSATLSVDNRVDTFRYELGIPREPLILDAVLPSPFDYTQQCQLYLPKHLPEPNDPFFMGAASDEIVQILNHTMGRAFVLVTSYSALDKLSSSVIPKVPFPCKVQGDLPKNRLVSWFKETPNSVLFATASFWEGIDIPGESLSCVIIDRIPFASPEDPVHSATVDRLKQMGKDWFNDFALAEAILRLKQGVGRLIRTQHDTGLIAILDSRLYSKGYGKKVLRSLPAARIMHILPSLEPDEDLIMTLGEFSQTGS